MAKFYRIQRQYMHDIHRQDFDWVFVGPNEYYDEPELGIMWYSAIKRAPVVVKD